MDKVYPTHMDVDVVFFFCACLGLLSESKAHRKFERILVNRWKSSVKKVAFWEIIFTIFFSSRALGYVKDGYDEYISKPCDYIPGPYGPLCVSEWHEQTAQFFGFLLEVGILCLTLMFFSMSFMLFIGVVKRNCTLCKTWLVINVLLFILTFLRTIIIYAVGGFGILFCMHVVWIGVQWNFCSKVCCFIDELEEEEEKALGSKKKHPNILEFEEEFFLA